MRQATSPTHIFTLPFVLTAPQAVQVTYRQARGILLQRQMEEMGIDTDAEEEKTTLTVELTQEETMKFAVEPVKIQVRVITAEGKAMVSNVIQAPVDEVIDRNILPLMEET